MIKTKVLLLRGVNVAGANRLPMPEFREMLAELGLRDVQTHIQSGNAVFHDPGVAGLTARIASDMLARFGFAPAMFLLDLAEFEAIVAANPYKSHGKVDGAAVHIYFLAGSTPVAEFAPIKAFAAVGESFQAAATALYLHAPAGVGRSVLVEKLARLKTPAMTERNQKSAEAIIALARGLKAV